MYFYSFILKNLTRRPWRTILTVLGLAVAVGSMVALLAINHNVERAVTESFNRRDVDLVVTQAGVVFETDSDFSEALVEKVRKLPEVGERGVSEALVTVEPLYRESGTVLKESIMVQGWRPDNKAFLDIELLEGRFLTEGDTGKVMLGSRLAGVIKKGIGDTIYLHLDIKYEVVGIYRSFVVFEDGAVTMSLKDAQKLTGKRITGFSVRVAKKAPVGTPEAAAEVQKVKEEIETLRDPDDPTARLAARTPDSYVDSLTHLKIVRAMSWMVSIIAMVIGIISVLNTMVMSVLERTQEIGILRAVGWPPRRIIQMVLGEAVVMGLLAALVGTLGALAATHLLAMSPTVDGFISPGVPLKVAALGVGITAFIGLLGGIYPAIRAARLLPTEAIRHD